MTDFEMALLVLDQALTDYTVRMKPAELREHADMVQDTAEEWIFSDSTEPRSFLWYCRQLGLEDPDEVRRVAKETRDTEDAKMNRRKKR